MVAKTEVNELKALLDELTYLFMEIASLYEYHALLIEADIHSYTSKRSE